MEFTKLGKKNLEMNHRRPKERFKFIFFNSNKTHKHCMNTERKGFEREVTGWQESP